MFGKRRLFKKKHAPQTARWLNRCARSTAHGRGSQPRTLRSAGSRDILVADFNTVSAPWCSGATARSVLFGGETQAAEAHR